MTRQTHSPTPHLDTKHTIKRYEHEIIHYEDETGKGENKTREDYYVVVEENGGYIQGEKLTPEKFTKLANRNDTETETTTQTQKLTGATRATQDQYVETAYITTTKVIPE